MRIGRDDRRTDALMRWLMNPSSRRLHGIHPFVTLALAIKASFTSLALLIHSLSPQHPHPSPTQSTKLFLTLQLTRQKLRPPHPKTPILLFVSSHTDYQICLWNSAFFFQSLCQCCIYILFLLCCASLLEYLDEDEFVAAGEGESGVFED